jgi:hypothetical protein
MPQYSPASNFCGPFMRTDRQGNSPKHAICSCVHASHSLCNAVVLELFRFSICLRLSTLYQLHRLFTLTNLEAIVCLPSRTEDNHDRPDRVPNPEAYSNRHLGCGTRQRYVGHSTDAFGLGRENILIRIPHLESASGSG